MKPNSLIIEITQRPDLAFDYSLICRRTVNGVQADSTPLILDPNEPETMNATAANAIRDFLALSEGDQ